MPAKLRKNWASVETYSFKFRGQFVDCAGANSLMTRKDNDVGDKLKRHKKLHVYEISQILPVLHGFRGVAGQ